MMGLRRTQAILLRWTPVPDAAKEGQESIRHRQVLELARLVGAAATHGPYRGNCLKQSLVLWWLLRLGKIESDFASGSERRWPAWRPTPGWNAGDAP